MAHSSWSVPQRVRVLRRLPWLRRRWLTSVMTAGAIVGLGAAMSGLASAQNEQAGGIVYGTDWAFLATAPEGWTMSLKSGLPVNAAFFQSAPAEKSEPHRPPAFMYITLSKSEPGMATLEALMKDDEGSFRSTSPGLKVSVVPPMKTADEKDVVVRRFDGTANDRSELVAYKQCGELMYKIVLTAPSPESLLANQSSFAALLSTFSNATIRFQEQ